MARTLEQILATEQQEIVADAKKMADDILTQLREHMQLTRTQLAAALGVTQPTIDLKNRFK